MTDRSAALAPSGAALAGIDIHVAAPLELGAAFAFLPGLSTAVVPLSNLLVARSEEGIVGAAALSTSSFPGSSPAFRADVKVHAGYRRRGVGRALVGQLAALARAWRMPALQTWSGIHDDACEVHAFLEAVGARPSSRIDTFESGSNLHGFLSRLQRRPSSGQVRRMQPHDVAAVTELFCRRTGELAAAVHVRMLAALGDPSIAPLCQVMICDEEIRGFIVFRRDGQNVPAVDFWHTRDEGHELGAMALMAEAGRAVIELDIPVMRFQAREDARATRHVARALDAHVIGSEAVYALAV